MEFSKSPKIPLLVLFVLLGRSAPVHAVTKTWVGGSNDWHLGSNWSPAGVPVSGDEVVFDGTSQLACYLTAPAEIQSIQMTSAHTGALDFQGSALIVIAGNADFRSGGSIVAGTGSLVLTGGGTQILYPQAGATHPRVIHDGPGTLQIAANTLNTLGFHQVNGVLDLTGASITTVTGGDFVIQNGGPSTMIGLGGRTLQIAGRTLLMGTSAGNLNLDPGSAWTLASTGPVYVDYANLGYCNAGVSAGTAYRSTDAGGNAGWSFPSATTFHWHRNPFSTGAFNRSHNWTSGMDGSGLRPPGIGDDPFSSDALGAAWTFLDADADATTGTHSLVERPDQLKLLGRGRGANTTYNEFVVVHRTDLAGNFDVIVRLVYQSPDAPQAEAGLLIADDPGALALGGYCLLGRSPDGTLHFRRDMDGDGILEADITVSGLHGPVWLRLVKDGSLFSAFYRQTPAGGSWQQLGTGYSIASAATASSIGLYSTSGDAGKTAEAVFDDFQAGGDIDGAFHLRLNGTGTNSDADAYLMANTAAASVDFTDYAGIFNFSGSMLDIQQGDAIFSSTMTLSGASGTLRFSAPVSYQNFVPKSGSSLPDIQKAGGGSVTVSTNPVTAMGFNLAGGTWHWGSGGATHSLNSITATGGAMIFGSNTVQVSGNADLSGLTTLNPESGTITFTGAAAQTFTPDAGSTHPIIQVNSTGTVTVATNALSANAVALVAGGLDLATNALGLTTSGNVSLSGGILSLASATIGGDLSMTGGTLNAPANPNNFSVAGSVSITAGTYSANSGTLTLDGTGSSLSLNLTGASLYGLTLNGTGATWIAASNITASGTFTLTSGTLDLSTNIATLSAGAYSQGGGTLSAASGTVDVNGSFTQTGGTFTAPGSARMFSVANSFTQTGGTFTPGDGEVTFDGAGTGNTINAATALNAIEFTGSGTWTVTTNNLAVGSITLAAATFNLGAGLTHTLSGSFAPASGTLDFGSSTLRVAGASVSLGALSALTPGTGTLEFIGSTTQAFTPMSAATHPNIKQSGSGTTTVSTNSLFSGNVDIHAGTLDIGPLLLTAGGNLTVAGGTLLASSGSLDINGNLAVTSGALSLPATTAYVAGSLAVASGATLTHNSGYVYLDGTGTGNTVDVVGSLYNLGVSGSGTWTVSNNGLDAVYLGMTNGTLNLGSLTHAVDNFSATTSGTLNFNSGTLRIETGNADFSSLTALDAGTGTLQFGAATGTQTLTPSSGSTHPHVVHDGAGTLSISAYSLACLSFTHSAGSLDLNGRNISTVSGGDFTLTNGTSTTFLNHGGSTLTVAGDASLSGASVSDKLNLNPASAWTFAVTGTLSAGFATLGNNGASPTAGTCTNCVNAGSNSGWSFAVSWDGGGADNNWSTAANWGSDVVPASDEDVAFDATSVKDATLDASTTIKSITFASGYTGTFSFGASTLTIASGNADFRSGGAVTPGTGTLAFTGSSSQVFYPKAGATFPAIVQNGNAGTTTVTGNALTAGDLTVTLGTFHLGSSLTHTVGAISGSGTGSLDFGTSNLNATGNVDLTAPTITATSSNTLAFTGASAQTFTPKASVTALNLAQNGAGGTTVSTYGFTAPTLTIASGTFNLGVGLTHYASTGFSVTGGGLDFGSSTLRTGATTVDLSSLASLIAGTGTLEFNGASAQVFIPMPSTMHPVIMQSGTGGTTLSTHHLNTSTLVIASGTLNLGTSLVHNTTGLSITGGSLDFGSSELSTSAPTVDFTALTTLTPGTGSIEFKGTSAQSFTPKSGVTHPNIKQNGSGGTTLYTNGLATGTLTLSSGTLGLGTGLTHSATAMNVFGGAVDFGSSTLQFSGTSLNLSNLASIIPGTGALEFTGASTTSFTPKTGATLPTVSQNGAGSTYLYGDLTANALSIVSGTLNLGSALTHTVESLLASGGGLGFGSSTLQVSVGNADLSALATLTPGTGTLAFTAASGIQIFIPRSASSHPLISHSGAGELELSTYDLSCLGFSQSAGTLDFGGRNITTTTSGGHFTISNGTASTLVGLGGRTLTVAGNASLGGASSTSRLNLDAATSYTLAVTGTLTASLVTLGNSIASVSAGACSNCSNLGTNSSWTFGVTWDGGGADNNWSTAANWGSDAVPTADEDITFNGTSVKDATLDASATVKSITFTTAYTGTFSFGASTLTISSGGDADFRSGGAITPGTGSLAFIGANAHAFHPLAGASFPTVIQNGAGSTTVGPAAASMAALTVTSGTFNLGSGLTHTAGSVGGSGTLDFGTSSLNATGTVDLSGLTVTAASGNTLAFTGAAAQSFTPNGAVTALNLTQNGAGGTTVSGNGFTTPTLTLSAGTFALGTGLIHSVTSALSVTGGGLDFGSSTLRVAAADINLNPLTVLTAGTGTLEFNGASAQTFTPKASTSHPGLLQSGTGGTTLSTNAFTGGDLSISNGTFALGAGFTHSFDSISTTGGGLDFGSSTLQTGGNANLSGLAALTPGTGALSFAAVTGTQVLTPKSGSTHPAVAHNAAGTLQLSTNALACASFTQTAGTLDLNGIDLSTVSAGDFTVTNGTSTSFLGLAGRTLTIAGNASFAGTSYADRINLDPGAAWTLAVTGALTASLASLADNTASVSAGTATDVADGGGNTGWTFGVTWSGAGADNNWSTGANWTSGSAPTSNVSAVFNGTSVKDATLDADASVRSISFATSYTGTFSFSSFTLTVAQGDADFRSGGGVAAGTGALAFTGTAAQTFHPLASSTFPSIVQIGAGGTTIASNSLTAGNLTVTSGAFNLGTGLAHSLAAVSGTGALDFGTSDLTATGNVDLSGLTVTAASANTLTFGGATAQTFTPNASVTALNLAQSGTGGTSVSGYGFTAPALTVTNGTLSLGTALAHTVSTTLTLGAGGLDFGASTLKVGGAAVDFTSLQSLTPGTGTLEFTGTSPQTFTPKPSAAHPDIVQSGAGGTTLSGASLTAGTLSIQNGTLALGAGFTHDITGLGASGGGLDFGSSTLEISGNADFSGLATLVAGSGTLSFTAATGTQVFVPKIGAIHPLVVHDAAGTVQLSVNDLEALGFSQSNGVLDLNGRNVTLSGSGSMTVTGSFSPFANLGGRALTIGGNARFAGTAGTKMALDPATAWTLAVSGTLTASNVSLRNSAASLSTGTADSSSNLGGNTGWTFIDTVKPDNVGSFVATATGGHTVALAWTAPTAQDADSVMLRYRADGAYPSGPTDGTLWRHLVASRTSDTATGLADKSIYHFAAFVKDSSGNFSPATAYSVDSARTPDVTPPAPVTAMAATGVDSTKAALAWAASTSGDADSVMIRYRTGLVHPTGSADGTLWKMLPVSATLDTITGLAPNTIYAFGLFVRDSSGNFSAAQAGAQDTSLYQRPVIGSIAIADSSGRTRDADPALLFTASGADSLRFSLLADTATAAWLPLKSLDSLVLGADGVKVLAAQFMNVYGRSSAWYLDTTLLDRTAPAVSLNLETEHSRWNWPASLTGLSKDPHSGTDRVFVTRQRLSDGAWFNGSSWVQTPDTAKLVLSGNDSLFSVAMPASAMGTGSYRFTARALDRAGNLSDAVSMDVAYQDNRIPALASGNISDTADQNKDASWLLDFGDLDAGDSLSVVSMDLPGWLTASPGPDTAWGPWPVHKTFRLEGRPLQAHVGNAAVQVRLQDRGGLILTWSRALHVRDVNDAPAFDDGQAAFAVREDSITIWRPKFKDQDPADRHTLAMLQGPAFAKVDSISVALAPGSRDVGDHPVRLVVSDGSLSDTLETVLTVVDMNDPPYAFPSAGWMSPAFWREDKADTFTVVVVDMDRNDDVNLATVLPSYITVSRSTDATGYNHAFRFTVKPSGKDTGAVNAALVFRDAAGAASQLTLMGRIQADNDAPTASIEESRTHAGAARFRLSVADEDGSLEETRFHYRLIGPSGDTLRRGIVPTANLAIHPLADGAYRLAVKAEDKDGLRQEGFTVADFNVSGATTLALDSGRWHMVGAPHASLAASAFGSGATLAGWDEAGDEGQPLARYATGLAVDSLRRGKGYWVRLSAAATLKAGRKDLLEAPFAMRLTRVKQGWNQIANPYPYWVDLSSTRLTFWEWDADRRDLVNAKGLLKPWAAYWVLAHKDTTVMVPDSPWFPAATAPVAKRATGAGGGPSGAPGLPGPAGASRRDDDVAYRDREDWTLRLALSAGSYHDATNLMGVRSASTSSMAGGDVERTLPDAPKFGEFVALHFERMPPSVSARPATASAPSASTEGAAAAVPDLGFATDLRAALDPEEEWWDFSVENSGTGESRARLTPHGLEALASGGLRLYLVRRGEALAVEPGGSVSLELEGERTHYSLVITPHADFAERLKGNFSISQNFPNPVTTYTSFRFFLPQSWDKEGRRVARDFKVRINLYDYSGRLVATAADGVFRPGSHILRWQPASRSGGALAKGAYVYRLETAGFTKSLRLIVE